MRPGCGITRDVHTARAVKFQTYSIRNAICVDNNSHWMRSKPGKVAGVIVNETRERFGKDEIAGTRLAQTRYCHSFGGPISLAPQRRIGTRVCPQEDVQKSALGKVDALLKELGPSVRKHSSCSLPRPKKSTFRTTMS